MTYEVIVYRTQLDYANRNGNNIDEGIPSKAEALKIGKKHFGIKKNEVVKVQSLDQEFIKVFKVETLFEIKKPVYELSDAIQGLNSLKLKDSKLNAKLNNLNKLNSEIFDYLNKNYIWD